MKIKLSIFAIIILLFSCQKEKKEKVSKTVFTKELEINYEFFDNESQEIESEITKVIDEGFNHFKNIFKGNLRDTLNIKYKKFTVQVRKSENTSGEADPGILILNWSENLTFGYAKWEASLLHELFHLWNAESFRYKTGKEHWFNEGFSNFYAYQTATKLGMVSHEDMLSTVVFPVGRYLGTKRLDSLSMREAGKDNQTKFDNFFLIYNGGWVAAMVLDFDIRTKTNNDKSLDNLMEWLYENFNRTEKLYDVNDIIEGIKITAGLDYTDFFDKYINGLEVIPVSNYFDIGKSLIDFKWNKKDIKRHYYLYQTLGIEN